ncbi:hypothetical protein [Haloferula sp. BvORR071]|uniref:hypothetical protein n=1 Tax=Haloferula sp. BvORR071 TaxID=1396141 RepID=UPI0005517487|nr:hypothetical protein [Haloferula sp. BvORR071]
MARSTIRLSLLLAASACIAAAQQAPPKPAPQVTEEAPPPAIPVEEPGEAPPPVAEVVEESPIIIEPGGNVPRPAANDRVVSRSGMFRVTGGESGQRGSVALLLEQTKDYFEALMRNNTAKPGEKPDDITGIGAPKGQMEQFKIPVDVILADKPVPRDVAYEVVVTPHAFFLRIRLHLARGLDHELLERAALNVLLYERALRDMKPEAYDENPVVRPWLVEGLMEAEKWRSNRADRRIYEGVFRQGGGFTPDEIFELSEGNYRRLDGASKLSFRALSGALVMALLEQPDGRDAFRSFCGEAARFSGEMPVLMRKHFPQLNLSANSLAKWWQLRLAQMTKPDLTEVLSVTKTELALEEALKFQLHDDQGNPVIKDFGAWKEVSALKEPDRIEAVRNADEALTRLSYRCFPSYRALLNEYQLILREVMSGKTNEKITMQLEDLTTQRQMRVQRAQRARNYLDFVEITQAREVSGQFDDYMRLKEEMELRPRAERHDRVTGTLDTMDKVFEPRRKR